MKILLSTYSYYPLQSGGTESYTEEFLKYLKGLGHSLCIIASSDFEKLQNLQVYPEILVSTSLMRIFKYKYKQTEVIGVELLGATLTDQYSKFNKNWVYVISEALKKACWNNPDALYMQGISGISGPALIEALKIENENLKIAVWVHTPFICIKGSFLTKGLNECNIAPGPKNCGACFIGERLNTAEFLSHLAFGMLNALQFALPKDQLPLGFPTLLNYHFECISYLTLHANFWISFSAQVSEILRKVGVPSDKIVTNSHGIDTSLFHSKDRKEGEKVKIFLYNGRWDIVKGYETLIKAWSMLGEKPEKRRLLIVSLLSEKDKSEWATFFNRNDVELKAFSSRQDLAALMRGVDCMLIPSEWIETGPLVFHEAIAAGCEVIASNIGGNKILHQKYSSNSWLFNAGEYKDLADKIEQVTTEPSRNVHYKVKDSSEHFEQIYKIISQS